MKFSFHKQRYFLSAALLTVCLTASASQAMNTEKDESIVSKAKISLIDLSKEQNDVPGNFRAMRFVISNQMDLMSQNEYQARAHKYMIQLIDKPFTPPTKAEQNKFFQKVSVGEVIDK